MFRFTVGVVLKFYHKNHAVSVLKKICKDSVPKVTCRYCLAIDLGIDEETLGF